MFRVFGRLQKQTMVGACRPLPNGNGACTSWAGPQVMLRPAAAPGKHIWGISIKESAMTFAKRCAGCAAIIGLALAATTGAYGQVSTINSAATFPREFNDVPGSTLSVSNLYPSVISFQDQGRQRANRLRQPARLAFFRTTAASTPTHS